MAQPNTQMQQVLDKLASMNPRPIETLSPEEARKQPTPAEAVAKMLSERGMKPKEPVADVDERSIPGPGGDIKLRVYTPFGDAPFPVLVYFHGGGWVIANLDTYDSSCRALCNAAGCVVVSVDYRQAPEQQFPAAVEDAHMAAQWVLTNTAAINGDPARVAIGGESAGGNLATVACMVARDQGGAMPIHQVLIYPVTTASQDYPSMEENANAKPLNKAMMSWFAKYYLPTPADGQNPLMSPLMAQSLRGLPPATIILADVDPLRDEGRAYAERLRAEGVPVTATVYEGVTHEFFGMRAVLDAAKSAVAEAATALQQAFGMSRDGGESAARARVLPGTPVVASDGKQVGKVKELHPTGFRIDRPMAPDVDVPYRAVSMANGQITLSVPAGQVGDLR